MAASSKSLLKGLWENLKGGTRMCFVLTPTSTTVGLLALILLNMTPVFDILGYIFYPITYILSIFGLQEPLEHLHQRDRPGDAARFHPSGEPDQQRHPQQLLTYAELVVDQARLAQ